LFFHFASLVWLQIYNFSLIYRKQNPENVTGERFDVSQQYGGETAKTGGFICCLTLLSVPLHRNRDDCSVISLG
jgi:hypothetical protein